MLDDGDDPLYDLFLKRDKWQIVLDDFYALPKNRHPIRSELVKNALIEGRDPVHGILEVYDDQAEMGHFHRVEVISVRADGGSEGEFCKVRLIDCGGHKIVPIVSVLRIHSKHCNTPPHCLQLCMSMPERPAQWSDELCVVFKRLLRSDMPIYCDVIRMNAYGMETPYKSPIHKWPGAYLVENVRLAGAGDPSTIDDQLQAAFSDRGSQSHA
ncbi:Protein EKL-1 [Aphelenchoides avenae]|nr:Protein EKL-1 [Aphelenchus avenae]